MFKASFSDVIEVLLIILLIYFGFKILMRWFGPLILRYILKKVGKQFEKKFGHFDQKQGTTSGPILNNDPEKKRKSSKDLGEYIDYEEIE